MKDDLTFGIHTVMFHTLGCKLNFAETSTMEQIFAEHGIKRVQVGETPNVIVINTCSVTEFADKKSRQVIRQMAKSYPKAIVIVTGCYAQLKSAEAAVIPGVKIVIGNDKKMEIMDFLNEFLLSHKPSTIVTPVNEMHNFLPSCSKGNRTRYFLKIQDGCDYYCSYCTIPLARGKSRSGTIDDIVKQARNVAECGGKEIVLTGVNIGDFGKGHNEFFFDLIKQLDNVDGIERYRISSIEPNLLTDDIINWVAQSRRFMPHFHIPLQSGCDEVLALMQRRYDTKLFRKKVEKIRTTIPDAFIGVDLIVGMRDETPERFEKSMCFIKSIDISRLHVFTYSERPGTKALNIANPVTPAEKHRRTRIMINLSEQKLRDFSSQFIGSTRPVLLEHAKNGKPINGFTDNYIKVIVRPKTNIADNEIVTVKLLEVVSNGKEMKGEILS